MFAVHAQDAPAVAGARRIHHVGITVGDLERSLAFYHDLLGMPVIGHSVEEDVGAIIGVSGASARIVDLDAGAGQILELLDYGGGDSRRRAAAPHLAGTTHVSLEVGDLQATLDRLAAAGHRPLGDVRRLSGEGIWDGCTIVYLRDPDGLILELIEPRRERRQAPAAPGRLPGADD